ncbi:centrosomal protein 20 isoform X2 [Aquarana catesbeiana]|uniref:centrosomal protein 20 isoform X2 n=1 Tax=Aquarana catesbeiana TaxID=8400 RepID=UPI003CC9BB2E
MATVADLKTVLTDTLDKRGVLAQLKAQIHAEVFAALDDRSEPRPVLSHENLLINEMIREYLDFNKYKYTSSVLTADQYYMGYSLTFYMDTGVLLVHRRTLHKGILKAQQAELQKILSQWL